MRVGAVLSVALVVASGRSALAQEHVPIGGRTATMGGAATAAGNDSAMPYLNPAGLAGVPSDIFAVSASVNTFQQRKLEFFFYPRGFPSVFGEPTNREEIINARAVAEFPSSVMYFKRIGPPGGRVSSITGVSLIIPRVERTDIVATLRADYPAINGTDQLSAGISRSSTDYYFGPTYALAIDDRIRLGVSAYGLYSREFEHIQYSQFQTANGGSVLSQQTLQRALKRDSWSFVPILGGQFLVTDRLWLGAALAAPSLSLAGSLTREGEASGGGSDPVAGAVVEKDTSSVENGDSRQNRPLRLNVGIAYEDLERFSIAADFRYYAVRSGALDERGRRRLAHFQTGAAPTFTDEEYRVNHDSQQSIGGAIGAEIAINSMFAVRGGGFSQLSDVADFGAVPDQASLYRFRMDHYGVTLGLGITAGSFDTTVGGVYTHSAGEFVTLDNRPVSDGGGVPVVVGSTADTFYFVLSGAVTSEEAKQTIRENAPPPPAVPRL